ncbi:MAG: insulinase family protein, partial [Syntrophaceae bacterium]|nr:insulinase family protein [Syntrophaceae bacterium]
MNALLGWGKILLIGLVSFFFLVKGIDVLIGSYSLDNPLEFIMYFFSSSMLIMVSAIGVYYSLLHMYNFFLEGMIEMTFTIKFRRIAVIVAAISLFLTFSLNAFAYDLEERVKKFTLKNGLKVLIVERSLSPTVSFYIRYKVGAADEADGRTGTAHFLEHMLFKGTKTIGTTNYLTESKILAERDDTINALDIEKIKGDRGDKEKIDLLEKRLQRLQKEAKKYAVENEIDRLYTENGGIGLNASTGYDVTTYHVSLPSNRVE